MNITTFITEAISGARYPLIFLLFFIDGNSTNFISSGIAATGALNIWIIWGAAIVIEICVDLFYYFLGSKLTNKQIEAKVGQKGEESGLLNTLDESYKNHPGLTLMIVKCLGPFAIPGILYMGKMKALGVLEFVEYALIVAVTRGSILSFLGYMVGKGIGRFMQVYDLFKILGIILITVVFLYLIYRTYKRQIHEWTLKIFDQLKKDGKK